RQRVLSADSFAMAHAAGEPYSALEREDERYVPRYPFRRIGFRCGHVLGDVARYAHHLQGRSHCLCPCFRGLGDLFDFSLKIHAWWPSFYRLHALCGLANQRRSRGRPAREHWTRGSHRGPVYSWYLLRGPNALAGDEEAGAVSGGGRERRGRSSDERADAGARSLGGVISLPTLGCVSQPDSQGTPSAPAAVAVRVNGVP